MTKLSKTIKCLILGGLLLSANCQKAEAFLFLPPMPGEPSFDAVNNAGKVISVAQEGYHTIKSGFSFDKAVGLLGAKGLNVQSWKPNSKNIDKKGKLKTPGKGGVQANSTLKIETDDVNENNFVNAFHTLFFTYDFSNSPAEVSESEFKTLYRRKAVEFKQDMAIDTYVTAKVMEDYLAIIDETLNRLEQCQNGTIKDNCTFFGMTMEKVEADSMTPPTENDKDTENAAQLGAARNAYIVTTVQDRLLRIIEELTSLEAIFQASRQIDIAEPINIGEAHSSAEDYLSKTYQFAYNNSHDFMAAKGTPAIKFNNRIKKCDGKSNDPNCPAVNKAKVEIDVMEDTELLSELPTIEEWVDSAVAIHNLKSMMHQYKNQYRQYLLQKKIHDDAKRLVQNSDKCVVDFLNRHSSIKNAQQIWYGDSEPVGNKRFDYENRSGISGDLIKAYDNASTDITIGTSNECQGYYEENSCPAGYTYNNKKCCETNKSLCACEVALITEDISDNAERTHLDGNPLEKTAPTRDDTDGFIDGTNAEKLEEGSRNSVELTWNLGREALLNAMRNPDNKLMFNPWNDQKILQEEYLRNKYRNIKMIINSIDQGIASFKLSSKRAGEDQISDNPVEKYIKAAASCLGATEAETAAKQKHCTGSYISCTATYSSGMVTTKVKRRVGVDEHGKPIYHTETYNDSQKASLGNGCTYQKAPTAGVDLSNSNICLTPQCLVNNYFDKRWPNGADGFYEEAQENGRLVAMNKMDAVIQERKNQEEAVHDLVQKYQKKITDQEDKVRRSIANLENTNKAISNLNEKKNFAADELRRTNKRIESITNEIKGLDMRKPKRTNEKDKIAELQFELKCIKGEKSATATFKTNRKMNEKENVVLTCNDYITTLSARENKKDENKYVPNPTKIEREIELLDKQVTAQKDRLDVLKGIVSDEQGKLTELKDDFATSYLKTEEDAQTAIENKNVEYERFLDPNMDDGYSTYKIKGEKQPYRMRNSKKKECYKEGFIGIGCKKKGPQRIKENNLSTSITTFIQNGDLNSAMRKELNKTFFSSMAKINSMLSGLGIPSSFAVDNTFSEIGLSGMVTPAKLALAVKDTVVKIAAEDLTNIIDTADKDIETAVDEAANEVEKYAKSHNIDGKSNTMPDLNYLMTPSTDHKEFLEDLRKISKRFAGEGVDNLFGIPSDDTLNVMEDVKNNIDDSYFVALPARGNNYRNIIKEDDKNAGRDYIAPKDMLSSVPPLREVFYFNAMDYDELPQKGGKPVLTELLQCKNYNEAKGICETEYLPEVWLHLLARPNLREDHKYWQTFVERSFGGNAQLSKLVQNQIANKAISPAPKDSDYRAIIARAGVYPCVTGGKYIDISGGDNVGNMQFKVRSSLPIGVPATSCQEVSVSGNKVTHLLADHKKGKNKDKENLGTTNEPMYEKHSELGQLLTKDLKYRPLQKNIQEFLLKEAPENDITRQKAERASFKRNVMGSFLDAMTTEYNARKNLEQSKKAIAETLKSLCEQFDSLKFADSKRKPVIQGCSEFPQDLDDLPIEMTDVDKNTIVDRIRLATDYTENDYYEINSVHNGAYKGISCPADNQNAYKAIFCALDAEKDNLVQKAQQKLAEVEKKIGNSPNGKAYIEERLDKIKDYIDKENGSLIIDNDEVTTIRPGTTPAKETGWADREVEIRTAEEGLEAMANQSQAVAYCPIY